MTHSERLGDGLHLLLRHSAFEGLGTWIYFQGYTGFDDKEACPSLENQKALVKLDSDF